MLSGGALSLKALVKWLVLGSAVGIIVGTAASLFGHALIFVNAWRGEHPAVAVPDGRARRCSLAAASPESWAEC